MRRLLQAVIQRFPFGPQRPVILMYHRVAQVARDPWDLAVPPSLFEEQMRYLREHRTVLSMSAMVQALQQGNLPGNAVAVTFDDGYRDNLLFAKPILDRYEVPATLFVATGLVGRAEPMWWDELADMILDAEVPADFEVLLGQTPIRLRWGRQEAADTQPDWKGWDAAVTARQVCFQQAWRALKALTTSRRAEGMALLRQQLSSSRDPLAEPMTADELCAMQAGGLVTLAPHTVTHASLPTLDRAACQEEIEDSARVCATLVGRPVQGFAYPFGDWDQQAATAVKAAGLGWACTTSAGSVPSAESDVYCLPRVGASTRSLQQFRRQLLV